MGRQACNPSTGRSLGVPRSSLQAGLANMASFRFSGGLYVQSGEEQLSKPAEIYPLFHVRMCGIINFKLNWKGNPE